MFVSRLQDMFISLLKPWIPFVAKIPVKLRYRLITACFMADIVLFGIVRYVLLRESYFYNTTLGIFLMIAIAILSLDVKLEKVRWRRSIWLSWFGMCIAFTVSDILVPKKVCGLGVVLALVFTGVFFVWQNNSRRDLLWECFKKSIRISFWIISIFSFCFRPIYQGGRYAGIFTNPNTFGLYLFVIFAVFMSDLDWDTATGKRLFGSLPTYISIALVWFYLEISQARTALLACGTILFMWLVLRLVRAIKKHRWSSFLKHTLIMIAFVVALYPVYRVTVAYLPWIVDHPLIFKGESLYLSDGSKIYDMGETVIAEPDVDAESMIEGYKIENLEEVVDNTGKLVVPATKTESDEPEKPIVPKNVMDRLWFVLENTKGLNALTSGRIEIYKGYYKQLNYKGHPNVSLTINGGKKAHAHNNWLQFGYTYGYFGLIFYTIITVLGVAMSIKFYLRRDRKNISYAFLIPAICVGFVVATMAECLFLPFEVFPAFAFWFVFGEIFVKKVPEKNINYNGGKYE